MVVTQPAPAQPPSATLQAFQQQQMTLAQSYSAMVAQGATPQQMAAWQQQNAAAFAAQQQRAQIMGMASSLQPAELISQPPVPANASQTARDCLAAQVTLNNAKAQIHNQLFQQQYGQQLQQLAQSAFPANSTTSN